MKSFFPTYVVAFLFVISACNSEEGQHVAASLDSLTGLDTNHRLISDEDLNARTGMALVPFLDGSAMGFADSTGKVIIPAQYEDVSTFRNGLATVRLNGKYGLINKAGKEILAPEYNSISDYACGVMWLGTDEGYYLINQDGKRVLPDTYEKAFAFTASQDRLPIEKDGKIAFFDPQGNQVTDFDYDRVGRFFEGVAPVLSLGGDDEGWGIIDMKGELIVPHIYRKLFPFKHGLGVASLVDANMHERYGVINPAGEVVIPFIYGLISGTGSEGYFVARKYGEIEVKQERLTNKSLIVGHDGQVRATLDYRLWDEFSEGLVVAEKDEKFGFVDTTGQLVIPFDFDWVCPFREGLAWAKGDKHYGFIDHTGTFVIPPKYVSNSEYVLMSKEGVLVSDPITKETFYLDPAGREYRNTHESN